MNSDIQLYLSIVSSIIGIIGGPLSLYFSYKAATRAAQAVSGSNELARRVSREALYNVDSTGNIVSTRVQIQPQK